MNHPVILKDILRFRYQMNEFREYNTIFYRWFLYRFFIKWRFFKTKSDSIKYKMPWITFPAIQYLDRYLTREMKVFEYGCGGSTLFFAMRAQEVISIEHDAGWFKKLSESLTDLNIKNVKIKNSKPEQVNDEENIYTSENENYTGLSFKNYVQEILQYPDGYFDVILIDGRARNGCFLHSIQKLKNTSEREIKGIRIDIGIDNSMSYRVAHLSSHTLNKTISLLPNQETEVIISIENLPLVADRYGLTFYCEAAGNVQDWIKNASYFDIENVDFYHTGKLPPPGQGNILLNYSMKQK